MGNVVSKYDPQVVEPKMKLDEYEDGIEFLEDLIEVERDEYTKENPLCDQNEVTL